MPDALHSTLAKLHGQVNWNDRKSIHQYNETARALRKQYYRMEEERNMAEMERVCPLCGQRYTEHPAISRKDNQTEICPACGVREALAAAGLDHLTEQVLEAINQVETVDNG